MRFKVTKDISNIGTQLTISVIIITTSEAGFPARLFHMIDMWSILREHVHLIEAIILSRKVTAVETTHLGVSHQLDRILEILLTMRKIFTPVGEIVTPVSMITRPAVYFQADINLNILAPTRIAPSLVRLGPYSTDLRRCPPLRQ